MKRRLFLPASVLLPLLLGLLLASGCSMDMRYDRYAVVYGISDYQTLAKDLAYTDSDAYEVAAMLTAQGYKVTLRMTTSDPQFGPVFDATYAKLQQDLDAAAQTLGRDDLFLFYFSGHGAQSSSADPSATENAPGSDSNDEGIVLLDDTLTELAFCTDDELAALLRRIPCAKKVVLIDACFSGGFIGNGLEADGLPPEYSGSMVSWLGDLGEAMRLYANFGARGQDYGSDIPPDEALVISACGEREVSWEPLHGHGVFTYFLLASATGGDANGDGYVTVSEAYDYIRRGINREWNAVYAPLHDSEVIFAPHVSGGPVDYVLFSSGD